MGGVGPLMVVEGDPTPDADLGQHHFVSARYLHQYANQAAWLEDNRRKSNGVLAYGLVQNAMGCPVSRAWKGYWQKAARLLPASYDSFAHSLLCRFQ